jgi:Tol biopolymer transport system component
VTGVLLAGTLLSAAPVRQTTALVHPAGANAPQYFGLAPQFALSPDGQRLAFIANLPSASPSVWVRSLAAADARPLAGTEQASYPFWSADGNSVGFFSGGKLKTVSATGGTPAVVCDASTGRGGTWNAANVIVFASGIGDPLRKVAAGGGTPAAFTTVDTPRENSHRWPQFLPDGKHVLFWGGAGTGPPQLKVASIDTADVVTIGPADANAAFGGGNLYFKTGNRLVAQRFDTTTFARSGEPVLIVDPISADAGSAFAAFAVAQTSSAFTESATVVYTRGPARGFVLTWFDRSGRVTGTGAVGQYTNATLSPDGSNVAVSLTEGTPPNRDIFVLPASASGVPRRLTDAPAVDATPVWSADGTSIIYSSQRSGPYQMFRRTVAGPAGQGDEQIYKENTATIATDWSRDGKTVAFTRTAPAGSPATGLDVWLLDLPTGKAAAKVETVAAEDNAAFSPDGRWVAYQSNASGRDEVYVTSVAGARAVPQRVSAAGGTQPRWRGDGKELFFLAPDGAVTAAAIAGTNDSLNVGTPQRLIPAPPPLVIRHSFTVSSDGQRVLVPLVDQRTPPEIMVMHAWYTRGR